MLAVPSSFFRNRVTTTLATRVTTKARTTMTRILSPCAKNQLLKSLAAMEFIAPCNRARTLTSTTQTDRRGRDRLVSFLTLGRTPTRFRQRQPPDDSPSLRRIPTGQSRSPRGRGLWPPTRAARASPQAPLPSFLRARG